MIYSKLLLFIFMSGLFFNLQCDRKGIIKGGSYIGKDNYNINAYYLYDFVTMDKVREHAIFSSENDEGIVINYYFSHNSNIPTQSLEFSTNINNVKELIGRYSVSIKYAFLKDSNGNVKLIDCMDSYGKDICNPSNI